MRMIAIIGLIFGAISVLIGILTTDSSNWGFHKQYALLWVKLPPKSMMEIADEIATSVAIFYKGDKVTNLIQYQFILHNNGSRYLDNNAIVTPLTWQGPGKILSAKVVATSPFVELELTTKDSLLEIRWKLFNQGCKAAIVVLCEGSNTNESNTNEDGNLKGQIRRVPRIKEKRIWWRDQDDIIRERRENLETEAPIQRMIGKIGTKKWFHRFVTWVKYPYVGLVAAMVALLIFDKLIVSSNNKVVAVLATAAIAVLILYLLNRKPYAYILRKAKHRSEAE